MKRVNEPKPDAPMLEAMKTFQVGLGAAGSRMMAALIEKQKDFEITKEKIKNDIQRGSRQSRGSIPH